MLVEAEVLILKTRGFAEGEQGLLVGRTALPRLLFGSLACLRAAQIPGGILRWSSARPKVLDERSALGG